MNCLCYCTAANYRLNDLLTDFKLKYPLLKSYREIIHLQGQGDIFIFGYGCVIFWGVEAATVNNLLNELKRYEQDPSKTITLESFDYQISDTTSISQEKDLIRIEADDPMVMLSISFALAQSVKLINFEDAVDKTIRKTTHIPQELAQKGKISLSRKQISIQKGHLFIVRNSINLNTEYLGTPEFFWENPSLEKYYLKVSAYLEIQKRVEVLNKRLDVIHDLFHMLTDELHHQHSSFLELVIIWLIMFEIILVLIQEFLRT